MKKTLLPVLLLLALTAQARAAAIAVYHTSDAHGWYMARPAAWDNANSKRLIGGFAALSAHLKQETTPYILLDSGDMFQGTPEGIFTKGLASAILMNQLGYSAAVPGNHDYDYTEASLRALAAKAGFPLLAANIFLKDSPETRPDYLMPYTIVEKAGKKIAVLGLAGKHTATSTRPENVKHLDFRDEAAAAAATLPEIKALQPDAVIALAHLGIDEIISVKIIDITTYTFTPQMASTLDVARAAPGIDLVLGGHDHTAILKGYKDPVSGVWFGESGYGLSYVTRALLDFDDATSELRDITVEIVPLWVDVTGQDPAVLKTVAGFTAGVEGAMGRVVGKAKGDLNFSPAGLDSAIGNLLCDLTVKAAGTDMAFHNTKAIRAEIKKGDVKLRDLYQAFPFDNDIITMRLSGAQIMRLVADNVIAGNMYMQVSGLEVAYKLGPDGKAAGIRLTRNGKAIKGDDEFTVATNDYLAFGGNGGDVFAGGRDIKDTMIPVRDLMLKAFEKGPVKPPKTGRVKRIR
jgi:5'-nucleotidase/UDP-sugar diphosphatase